MKDIFISHSSKDKELVNVFIDKILCLGLNILAERIFCTSTDGMDIKTGDDWRKAIGTAFNEAEVIILIITPNYKASEICLNEMGAAWLSNKKVIPVAVEPIEISQVGILNCLQITELNDKGLDKFQESITDKLPELNESFKSSKWNSKKRDFLSETKGHMKDNPFPRILSQDEIETFIKENELLQSEFDEMCKENEKYIKQIEELEKLKNPEDVILIKKKYQNQSIVDQYKRLVTLTKEKLNNVDPIIRTLIFNNMYGKYLDYRGNFDSELKKAHSKNLIDDEDKPIWTKNVMKEIEESIDILNNFITSLSSNDVELLAGTHIDYEIDLSDLDYWENVLGVRMSYIS